MRDWIYELECHIFREGTVEKGRAGFFIQDILISMRANYNYIAVYHVVL